MESKGSTTFEVWKVENDSLMSATSYKVSKRDTTWLEAIKLVFSNGKILYMPVTKDQNQQQPIAFTLVTISGNKYTFENKTHDFPQLITYDLQSKDRLLAAISGPTTNGPKTINYPFEKIPDQ